MNPTSGYEIGNWTWDRYETEVTKRLDTFGTNVTNITMNLYTHSEYPEGAFDLSTQLEV